MSAESDRVAKFGGLEDGLRQASEWYLWGPYLSCLLYTSPSPRD